MQELCKKFPDKKVMFGIIASDYPRVAIAEGLAIMQALVNASMYVYNDGSWELAFTLALVSYKSILCDYSLSLLPSHF